MSDSSLTKDIHAQIREILDDDYAAEKLGKLIAEMERLRFACPFCGCEERFTNHSGSCRRCGAPEDLANTRNHLLLPPWDAVATHLKRLRGVVDPTSNPFANTPTVEIRDSTELLFGINEDDPSQRHVTTVGGIEHAATLRYGITALGRLDTAPELASCPFCSHEAAYREQEKAGHDHYTVRVECSNTSCMIATPYHYRSRQDAAQAWNRRAVYNLGPVRSGCQHDFRKTDTTVTVSSSPWDSVGMSWTAVCSVCKTTFHWSHP